jgi:hypothetical protein
VLSSDLFQKRSFRSALHGQVELLALHDLRPVDVEEIGVEDGLDEAGDHGNGVEVTFHCVSVDCKSVNRYLLGMILLRVRDSSSFSISVEYAPPDPVGNVESSVRAQRKDIVGCDCLCAAGALQHEQLRKDRDTLQPDAERPEHLGGSVLVGENDGKHSGSAKEVFGTEGVLVRVVGGLVIVEHQVNDVGLGGDEDDLEGGVPERKGRVSPQEI